MTNDQSPFGDLNFDESLVDSLKGEKILVKYGGNAMKNDELKYSVVQDICFLMEKGLEPVIVHGGGPFIADMLDMAGIVSEFIGGHRKTDLEAVKFVEMALKGQVNSDIVKLINSFGYKGVGLSGKDGQTATAMKRRDKIEVDGKMQEVDLGQVGDIKEINTDFLNLIMDNGYIPVVAPLATGEDYETYNVNADMFAGHLAGALKVSHYIAMTDVDGLLKDKEDPETLIHTMGKDEARSEIGNIIQSGMIPKVESCLIALEMGVKNAHIINGMAKHSILDTLITNKTIGTIING